MVAGMGSGLVALSGVLMRSLISRESVVDLQGDAGPFDGPSEEHSGCRGQVA